MLGFAMFGAEAGEVMAVVQMAMLAGMPSTALRDAILAHPTMAERRHALLAYAPALSNLSAWIAAPALGSAGEFTAAGRYPRLSARLFPGL